MSLININHPYLPITSSFETEKTLGQYYSWSYAVAIAMIQCPVCLEKIARYQMSMKYRGDVELKPDIVVDQIHS